VETPRACDTLAAYTRTTEADTASDPGNVVRTTPANDATQDKEAAASTHSATTAVSAPGSVLASDPCKTSEAHPAPPATRDYRDEDAQDDQDDDTAADELAAMLAKLPPAVHAGDDIGDDIDDDKLSAILASLDAAVEADDDIDDDKLCAVLAELETVVEAEVARVDADAEADRIRAEAEAAKAARYRAEAVAEADRLDKVWSYKSSDMRAAKARTTRCL
jgi:hypothetical protein